MKETLRAPVLAIVPMALVLLVMRDVHHEPYGGSCLWTASTEVNCVHTHRYFSGVRGAVTGGADEPKSPAST